MLVNLVNCGLTLQEARGTTLLDYQMLMTAKWIRDETDLSKHRDVIATIMNFGGMGLEESVSAKELMPLTIIDNLDNDEINTKSKAMELIKYIANH